MVVYKRKWLKGARVDIFIDFNGLPGSGKSTVCKDIVIQMKQMNENVIMFQDYIDKRIRTNFDSIKVFCKGIIQMRACKLLKFVYFFWLLPVKAPEKLYRMYLLILNYILYVNCRRENPNTYIISEQCLVQEIVSCYGDQLLKSKKGVIKVLSLLQDDYIVINACISADIACIRIQNRKKGESRLDKMNIENAKRILSIQQENFDMVRALIKQTDQICIDLEMTHDAGQNAKSIVACLKGRMDKFEKRAYSTAS